MAGGITPLIRMLSWHMNMLSEAYSLFKLIVHSLSVRACAGNLFSGLDAMNFPQSSLV